jgi:hypothetical protein
MSAAYDVLLAATAAVGFAAMALAYQRSRDPLHPLLLACPMALFLYAYLPWTLEKHETLSWFVGPQDLERAQAVFLVLFAAFCAGALLASGRARWSADRPLPALSAEARRKLLAAAAAVGSAGLVAWGILIASEGGLSAVYDQPHGGDVLHPSGWVRESTRLALVGVLLTLAASQTWRSRLLALAFAAPHVLHAALGTRRGPAFVTAFLLVGGLYVFRGRRPPVLATLAGGTAVGLLLLFLLANRSRIYYGSDTPITFDLTDSIAFHPNAGNDHVVAAGLVATAHRTGRFGWGVSYVEQMFLRPIPREWLPDKYEVLEQATVGAEDVGVTLGWRPPPGWSPTLFAHLYIEFGWLSAAVSFLLGWAYGWVWRQSVESGAVGWLVLNVLLCSGLLHLVAQEFWAMAVPLLLMFVPAAAALGWALDRPFRGPEPATSLPSRLATARTAAAAR